MTDKFIQNVKTTIATYDLFKKGDRVIIGVSGGADSIALLNTLHQLQHTIGLRLSVAHFNHNLRKDSIKDQHFVENTCANLGIPCDSGEWSNPQILRQSVEDTAREKRLSFLIKIANKRKAARIALAHNYNDQAETILMRILRGTGLRGFRGILPKTEFRGVTLIRPLLQTNRGEITAYLKRNKILYRTDPTNKQNIFFRNKIRNQLMPYLKTNYSPNIEEILSNLAENISVDFEFLDQYGRKQYQKYAKIDPLKTWVEFRNQDLNKQPPAIRRILLRAAIEEVKKNTKGITLKHIHEIEKLLSERPLRQRVVNLVSKIKVVKNELTIKIAVNK